MLEDENYEKPGEIVQNLMDGGIKFNNSVDMTVQRLKENYLRSDLSTITSVSRFRSIFERISSMLNRPGKRPWTCCAREDIISGYGLT